MIDITAGASAQIVNSAPQAAPPSAPLAALLTDAGVPVLRAAYSDRTAALMAQLSAFAYNDLTSFEDQPLPAPDSLQALGFNTIVSFHNGLDDGWAYVAEGDRMIALIFRGTASELNWRTNLRAIEIRPDSNNPLLKVHAGFYAAYKLLANGEKTSPAAIGAATENRTVVKQVSDAIRVIAADIVNPTPGGDKSQFANRRKTSDGIESYIAALKVKTNGSVPIYIAGHSLGGALAQIAAAGMGDDQVAACYTFGSPRVGNVYFDLWVKPPSYRIINYADIVPQAPLPIGYRHSGDARYLPDKVSATPFRFSPNIVQRAIQLFFGIRHLILHGSILWIEDHAIRQYADKLLGVATARTQQSR
jgi:hypothetical protein